MGWLKGVTKDGPFTIVGWVPDPPDETKATVYTLKLGITRVLPAGDWDYYLEEDLSLRAALSGQGPWRWSGASEMVDSADLARRFGLSHPGLDLADELARLGINLPKRLRVTNWRPRSTFVNSDGERLLPPAAFHEVSAQNVRDRVLPDAALAAGLKIDPTFIRNNNINTVVRVVDQDGNAVYLKTEENQAAIRAEVLCSAIWLKLGWPGLSSRASVTDDGLVLIIPAVGTSDIRSMGSFQDFFRLRVAPENPKTLRSPRAASLLRVRLRDLKLHDDDDVLRFVMANAVWGNTDRHRGNICYGWEAELGSVAGGRGFILPIDHGRCFFNNGGLQADEIVGDPASAVTGAVGNPHQLLRAFVECASIDEGEAARVLTSWLDRLGGVLAEFDEDPEWRPWAPEIACARDRVDQLRGNVEGFLHECRKVVVT